MELLNYSYETIRLREQRGVLFLQIHRPDSSNSINSILIKEIRKVLVGIESLSEIKVLVLEGSLEYFCTGMDFKAVQGNRLDKLLEDPNEYYEILKYFSICSKVVVSKVDGQVNAGGIGFVAASDIVIAGENASFGLSEALFGLLPACVMPFLIRRIGPQKAQWMALTTEPISSNRAFQIGLVDQITENPNEVLRKNLLRLTRLDTKTVKDLKNYISKLWLINEQTQHLAVSTIEDLLSSEKVQNNISNFVNNGEFPWDK